MSDALYHRDGPDRFTPTELSRGPWDPNAQHGGAPAALLAGELERAAPETPGAIVRLTYELLRPVPLDPLTVMTRVLRHGKRVQLVEASLHAGEQEVCRATALRIRRADVPVPAPPDGAAPPRGPHESDAMGEHVFRGATTFARDAMEVRFASGAFDAVGPAIAWFRLRVPVVAGEQPSPLQRLAAAGDFGNGIAASVPWTTHVFINPDLTLYVEREPVGEWVGLDALTRFGAAGAGVSDSVLFDERGRLGRAQQALYVDARPEEARS